MKGNGKFTGMTSLPIPSAGIRPILRDCLLTVDKDLIGSLNIIAEEKRVFGRTCHRARETRLYYDLFVKRVALIYFKRQNLQTAHC